MPPSISIFFFFSISRANSNPPPRLLLSNGTKPQQQQAARARNQAEATPYLDAVEIRGSVCALEQGAGNRGADQRGDAAAAPRHADARAEARVVGRDVCEGSRGHGDEACGEET